MAAQFHPLSPQTDYSIASTTDNDNGMDEISLASSSHITTTTTAKSKIISSGASVSSKFSRVSKRTVSSNNIDNSDLGVPLTSSTSLDADDNTNDNYTDNETGGSYIGAQTPNTQLKKSYISEDDPFYIFRTDLEQKLTLTSSTLTTYLQLVQTTDTATNTHQIREYKKQLKRYIKQCESTINDLTTTIKVVTNNRSKFLHITNKELNDRKEFVDSSSDTIVKIKLDMNSECVKEKIRNDELALRERRKNGGNGGDNVATAISSSRATPIGGRNGYSKAQDLEEGNNSSSSERAETLLMMKQQDDTLTDLDMAVTRVGYMVSFVMLCAGCMGCVIFVHMMCTFSRQHRLLVLFFHISLAHPLILKTIQSIHHRLKQYMKK